MGNYNGTSTDWDITGLSVDTWYYVVANDFNVTTDTFDYEVFNASGTSQGSSNNAEFGAVGSSLTCDEFRFAPIADQLFDHRFDVLKIR